MKRRKILVLPILFIMFLSVSLTGCFSREFWEYSDWLSVSQRELGDKAMSRLCDAIERRDAGAAKAEFAYSDIHGVENFDQSVTKLFDYVKGDNITFTYMSSGSDGASMGGYPRERVLGGVEYIINTSTDTYKVCFDYRSYYSDKAKNFFEDKINKDHMGFIQFDIIDTDNDRPDTDLPYHGCPETKPGINFDYKTIYLSEYDSDNDSFVYKKIYCDVSENFEPVIVNSVAELNEFYEINKDAYTLASRSDGHGYVDVVAEYDDDFFKTKSICLTGRYNENGNIRYVPQWLYISDIVMARIAPFEYEDYYGEYIDDFGEKGIITVIELPEKVSSDIQVKITYM